VAESLWFVGVARRASARACATYIHVRNSAPVRSGAPRQLAPAVEGAPGTLQGGSDSSSPDSGGAALARERPW
jgi:hypothetical protein